MCLLVGFFYFLSLRRDQLKIFFASKMFVRFNAFVMNCKCNLKNINFCSWCRFIDWQNLQRCRWLFPRFCRDLHLQFNCATLPLATPLLAKKKKEKHVVTPIKLSIAVANKAPKWKLHFMTVYSNQIGRNWLVRQRLLALWISAWVKNVSGSFITLFQVWLKSFMPRTNLSLTSRLVLLCRQIQRFPSLWFNVVYIYKPRHHSFLTQVKHKKYW